MDMKTYLLSLPYGGKAALAEELGVPQAYLYQMTQGIRPISAERAIQIERITRGAVRCEDLRPDIDWSVLRSPAPQQAERSAA